MKNLKKILFVLIIILGLTGCSFGSKDKEETKEKEKKKNPVEIADPLEIDPSLFNYVGSFKNNEYGYTLNVYVSANSNNLTFEFTIPGTSDASLDEDGKVHVSMDGGQSVSFNVDEFKDNQAKIDDEFLGLKGTIKKVDNAYEVDLIMGDASEAISLSGKYEQEETKENMKGYYSNGDYKAIAITPLKDSVFVTTAIFEDGIYGGGEYMCEFTTDTKISCDGEDVKTITQNEDGKIKVDGSNKKIKGEYVINLEAYEKE